MASINSVTGSLSSTAALRGYGGLSSGLDRDSLIESLTYGTRTKIENQQAKKTKIGWQQTAMRSIIDKGYNFTNTYTSYTSSTNLASSMFFARSNISTVGDNSKYVSVSGTSSSADQMTIMGVKQLASDAKLSGSTASASALTTGEIKLSDSDNVKIDQLDGTYLTVKVGNSTYYANIGDLGITSDMDEAQVNEAVEKALNDAFGKTDVGDEKLSAYIEASVDRSTGIVTLKGKGSSAVEITGGTALGKLGLDADQDYTISNGGTAIGTAKHTAVETSSAKDYLTGKSLTFNYNGESKSITLDGEISDLNDLQQLLQSKLDSAFGKGRISVGKDVDAGKLTFTTTIPDGDNNASNNKVDNTSTLSITGGSKGLLGENSVLGIKAGAKNRVDLSKSLTEAGLANTGRLRTVEVDGEDGYSMVINGTRFAFRADTSVQDIINEVNKSDIGVKITYSADSDKFTIASTEKGAGGQIKMYGGIAEAMFGSDIFTDETGSSWKAATVQGQDAIIAVKYAGDTEAMEIRRGTNSFTMDGLTVNVNGTFGYGTKTVTNADGSTEEVQELIGDTEAVKFEATADVDKILKGITDMINAYNEVVAMVNKELKAKPDSDYKNPLTATQKEEMSEDQIKDYEEKAKQGLLFGDSDLRSFSMDLRYVLAGSDIAKLAEIGITESSEYSENGKLVIDEAKLRAALEKDSEAVGELFAGKDNPDGTTTAGLVDNMKTVMDKYCGTVGATKGVLVQKAGSEHSPLSLLQNDMKTQMDEIADYLERLLDRLENEEDRYIKQFTSLETLISQMNSQSSYLSSISGGY